MRTRTRIRWLTSGLALLGGSLVLHAGPPAGTASAASTRPPDLSKTGLYSDFASRTIDARNLAYAPQYPLWSDGAQKRRWIYLPPGTSIDASDPDVWVFPVGAKIWKEFSFAGHRVETRFMEAVGRGTWAFASYAWDADETAAVLVPEAGLRGVVEIRPGTRHDIPAVLDCMSCHGSPRNEALGFSALQLSSDRDPNAPHAEPLAPGMVDLQMLIQRRLIRNYPREWSERPPRIAAQSPSARSALGYLHANCGSCHNPSSALATLGMNLRHSVAATASGEPALETTVRRAGHYRMPDTKPGETDLVRPGDAAHSTVLYRMATRNPFRQMPPLGTKIVDDDAVKLLQRWIQEELTKQ